MRTAIASETEPIVTLTHLLQLCRDEHRVLWENSGRPDNRRHVDGVLAGLDELGTGGGAVAAAAPRTLGAGLREALAAALEPAGKVPPVVVARALAEFLDDRYSHTFTGWFASRSPYQPDVGDPVPLDSPDLRAVLTGPATSPPWRLANRLDETRHVRLAGEWAVQFRVVFDYGLYDTLTGLIGADTVIATCHPNRDLHEFGLPAAAGRPTFPVQPLDTAAQEVLVDRLVGQALAAGASVVVLPELTVTEAMAMRLQRWVLHADGPRVLIAGSYHHQDDRDRDGDKDGSGPTPRRNTALGWVRGHDQPLLHDKYSAADRPVLEDIEPQGWPELRVYVTSDGWHLTIAVCRDLLNPQAVYVLAEAGVNLALVPAMSETLMTFGGPIAQLVGDCQALVAIANNPAEWAQDGAVAHPARALFGHPGLERLTHFVRAPDNAPGVSLLAVATGRIRYLPLDPTGADRDRQPPRPLDDARAVPAWVRAVTAGTVAPAGGLSRPPGPVVLRPAAVLVLLADGPAGPSVVLTERAADLTDYPGELVFPGGAAALTDTGPAGTALREAHEEIGLDPAVVRILGQLDPIALPETGFLVDPVLAWSGRAAWRPDYDPAEVASCRLFPLRELASGQPAGTVGGPAERDPPSGTAPARLGRMTRTILAQLLLAAEPDLGPATAPADGPPPAGPG